MSPPQRIASLISSATEMLFAIGAGDRVVAVSHECDHPTEAADRPRVTYSHVDPQRGSGAIDDQVKLLVAEGAALYGIDQTLLERLEPQLIVTQAQCDVCAVRYDDVIDMVGACDVFRGTEVLALNPQSLDDILSDVERVGRAVGRAAAGEDFARRLRERIERVRQAVSTIDRPVRVACIEWIEPTMLSANWMPELIRLAGGDASLSHEGHSTYSAWDDVVNYDPEVIVVMPCGFDLPRTISEAAILPERPGWQSLSAVKEGRVFAVDGNAYFNRSGPRIVDSLEILAHLMHPERIAPPLSVEQRSAAWRRL
ncbi:MAG: cobalamin-binding protein [Pirellulaceae bacterium]